jgi:Glycine cleavage H-protein
MTLRASGHRPASRGRYPIAYTIGETMTDTPTDLRYSPDHIWVRSTAGSTVVRVGTTDHAQEALGDIVSVTVPIRTDAAGYSTSTSNRPPSTNNSPL